MKKSCEGTWELRNRLSANARAKAAFAALLALPALVFAANAAEPGISLIEEDWSKGWSAWTVSNRDDIVTLSAAGGVLRAENRNAADDKRLSFFTIRSELVKVEPGADFAAIMESRGNIFYPSPVTTYRANDNQIRGFVPATAVLWYKADRTPLLAMDISGVMLPTGSSFWFSQMWEDAFSRVHHFGKVPEGAAYAALQIGGQYPAFKPGKWLELRRLALRVRDGACGDWDFGDVRPPEFERVSPSPDPDPKTPFVFRVMDESPIAKMTCRLDGQPLDFAKLRRRPVPGGTEYTYVPETPWANESLHRMAVEATDTAGNMARETLAYYCGPRPKVPTARIRDDGVILLDGKPFFPIGTSGTRPGPADGYNADRMCADLAANGFNFVMCTYSYRPDGRVYYDGGIDVKGYRELKELEEYLAAARRHGLYIRAETASFDYGTEKRIEEIVASARFYRNRPEFLFHSLSDDTASHVSVADLKNEYNVCRAVDDARLTISPDDNNYEGRYAPYTKASDIFAQEIYPFRNPVHEADGHAQAILSCSYAYDALRRTGAKNRSIWAILQAFCGSRLWKKYPSREIIRAQVFLSIIHGSRGIYFFVYWADGLECIGSNRKNAEDVYSITRDVASISEDLTSRDAKEKPSVEIFEGQAKDPGGYTSVSCLVKEGAPGKGRLLLTASSLVYGSVKARIKVDAKGMETLFENGRKPDFRDGVLTESYAPGEVHVYRLVD